MSIIISRRGNRLRIREPGLSSSSGRNFSALGTFIGNNTQLKCLDFDFRRRIALGVADRGFFDGLKRNTSIHELKLAYNELPIIWLM